MDNEEIELIQQVRENFVTLPPAGRDAAKMLLTRLRESHLKIIELIDKTVTETEKIVEDAD